MSAAAVPASERLDWFTDVIAHELVPLAIRSERGRDFWAEASVLDLGGAQVSSFEFSSLHSLRTAAHVRSSDPEQYQLGLVTTGSMSLAQNRNESGLFSGDMVLWDTSRPMASDAVPDADGGRVRAIVLSFPRDAMPLRGARVERLLAHRIAGGHGMGAILAQYMRSLAAHAADCGPAELNRLGTVAQDLVGACLAGQLGTQEELSPEARTRALLERIEAFVHHNLGDPDLTPSAVAARHGISLRHLQQLFRDRGETVAAGIRRRRLERCRADLADPGLLTTPVHTVARRWGFTNASVFSRTFREAYGTSPTEFRHGAVREALARKINEPCACGTSGGAARP
ncbi:AraC-like ligand-binding domain-containing protein [Streptomyces roseus]|uniref:AraC family transcriptional regulator n=1 Tax=Streptomyces roseus TaxID=66430 RepID=A0A0J6XKK9_9ACTN|nr:helix-turn-helix domain-containing protein [Streptomyces roseus]KMO96615.1 AraC family transcriptional regulator [Streptomyces roseus]